MIDIAEEIRAPRVSCAVRGCPCAATRRYHGLRVGRPPKGAVGDPYCPAHYYRAIKADHLSRRRASR